MSLLGKHEKILAKIRECAEPQNSALVKKFRYRGDGSDYITAPCYRMRIGDFIEEILGPEALGSDLGLPSKADQFNVGLRKALKALGGGVFFVEIAALDHTDVNGRDVTRDDFIYFEISPPTKSRGL